MKSLRLIPFLLLILNLFSCHQPLSEKSIAFQPYEQIPSKTLDSLVLTVKSIYNFKHIYILPHKHLPKQAFVTIKTPRFRADSIIQIQKINLPDSINFIIGITTRDISTTKKDSSGQTKTPKSKYQDWGIMGLGFRPGSSSIVSTYRIQNPDRNLFLERLKKICIHEIGHNLGLEHCTHSNDCVMRDAAETVKTIDEVRLELCEICQKKL